MTTPDNTPTSLHDILNDCPYRQHSLECRRFHTAMNKAEAAIEGLVPEKKKATYISEMGIYVDPDGTADKRWNEAIDTIHRNFKGQGDSDE